MRNLIILVVLFFAVNAFSFDNCMHTIDQTPIDSNRIIESEAKSFMDCPASIMLNGQHVRPLTQVKKVDQKVLCTYGTLGLNLTCIRD